MYVSNSSAIFKVRAALEKALEKTEKTSVQELHLRGEWEPRCVGAYVESHVRDLSVPSLDFDEQADALWNDIAVSSQQVKNESRHSARGKIRFFCKEVKYVEISPDDKDLRFRNIPTYLLRPHPAHWVGTSGRNTEVEFVPAKTVHIKSKLAMVAKTCA